MKKIMVISDVHGNAPRLRQAFDWAVKENISELWNLGDVFGYGPEGPACFEQLIVRADVNLMGNHDYFAATGRVLIEGTDPPDKDMQEVVGDLYSWENKNLGGWSLYLCHASPVDTLWEFISSPEDARFAWMKKGDSADMILVGHTHKAAAYWVENGRERWVDESMPNLRLQLVQGRKYLLNPGSIGAGKNQGSFMVLELDDAGQPARATWHRLPN